MVGLYENMLNAIANKVRVDILKLLSKNGKASFTEIMEKLKMDPKSEAGKFGYHLRLLMKANLITLDESTGKYILTDLGRQAAEYMWSLEEAARLRAGEMLVRTSSLTIEPFDRRKIAEVLVREANAPRTLADAISKEAEERLSKLQIKYLTAALIREFVNAILLEKGLEEYRHSLTRLGLPVYDVTEVIKNASKIVLPSPDSVHRLAGDAVFEEYTLLKALPRSIGDAHLAGALHFNNSQNFVLKVANIQHDLRVFFKNGLLPDGTGMFLPSQKPPSSLESALMTVVKLIATSQYYVSSSQAVDAFNVFLAPYARNLSYEVIKNAIYDFVQNVNMIQDYKHCVQPIALGLEVEMPKFLENEKVAGKSGIYGDFEEESIRVAEAMLDVLLEGDGYGKPFITPQAILKLRKGFDTSQERSSLLHKACNLASKWGTIYFENLYPGWQGVNVGVCGDLSRLDSYWKGDWELGCYRTGVLDNVTINLPRVALESRGDDDLFMERLEELLDLCYEALVIKRKIIEERINIDGIMPFMAQVVNGDIYYHLENGVLLISYVGLPEAVLFHTGLEMTDDTAQSFAKKIVQTMNDYVQHARSEDRLLIGNLTFEPVSSRLTRLDSKMQKAQKAGTNAPPIYTELSNTPHYQLLPLKKRIEVEGIFHPFLHGGHLLEIKLAEPSPSVKTLFEFVEKLTKSSNIGLFCFTRDFTVCNICGNISGGLKEKCSKCGHSGHKLVRFSRVNGMYRPSLLWSADERWVVENSQRYSI